MNPKEELEKFKNEFDLELENYLHSKESNYKEVSPFVFQIFKNITEFTLRGGKRLRPALLFHAYSLFGGNNKKEIIKLSVFVELIQSYLLIHDDIFDHADTRRGGATLHKIYEKLSIERGWGDASHFGITLGILAGDIASQLANDLITNSDFIDGRKNKVLSIVSTLTTDVLIGQIEDFILSFKTDYKEQDIEKIHSLKTVAYTFDMPLLAGAVLAGKNENDSDTIALKEYAKFAGAAFQIRDDILGIFGDEEKTGKPSLSDIKEGKKTLLTLKAEENANKKQLSVIKNLLGKKNLIEKEAKAFREIIIETGALDYSKSKCQRYVDSAKNELGKIKIINNNKDFLISLADYLVIRDI